MPYFLAAVSLLIFAWGAYAETTPKKMSLTASPATTLPIVCQQSFCSEEFLRELTKAKSGDAVAQNRVGEMYHFGEGVRQDYKAARQWYLNSSAGGNEVAPNHLGRLYLNGEGVEKDEGEACRWYKISGQRGDSAGANNYDSCNQRGYR